MVCLFVEDLYVVEVCDVHIGRIAQLVEHSANNAAVLGSSPNMTIALLHEHHTSVYTTSYSQSYIFVDAQLLPHNKQHPHVYYRHSKTPSQATAYYASRKYHEYTSVSGTT